MKGAVNAEGKNQVGRCNGRSQANFADTGTSWTGTGDRYLVNHFTVVIFQK